MCHVAILNRHGLVLILNVQSDTFSSMSTSLKGSAGRLGRMAASGNKVAIFKLSGMIIGAVLVLWFIWGLFV
jgi:blocked-early-in-transport protein 1